MEKIIDKARLALKVGVQSKAVINENVLDFSYRKVAKSGLNCIDYNITWDGEEHGDDYSIYEEHKRIADKYNITFSQVHSPRPGKIELPYDMPRLIQMMKDSVKVCEILDSRYLVVHPLKRVPYMTYEDAWQMNVDYFSKITEAAKAGNVMVCIENLQDRFNGRVVDGICASAADIVKLIKEVEIIQGADTIGACLDVGHANILRKDMASEIRILGKYLKVLHMHDNNGDSDDHQIPYSFSNPSSRQTTTDWSGFLFALRQIGFKGVLSFETYAALVSIPAPEQEVLLQYLYKIGQHFSYIICYEKILETISDREIILFGTGKMFDAYMREFGDKYRPSYAVDNNSKLWGSTKDGIKIISPQELLNVKSDKVVIVCNQYFEEVITQLEEIGIEDYILYEELYRMAGRP